MRISKSKFLIIELFMLLILMLQTSGIVFAGDDLDEVTKLGGEAVRYLKIAGSALAIGVLVVYAIRWFMASPPE